VSKTLHFGRSELARARELVAQEADEANLSSGRTTDLVIAVNEVVANSVRHGGGGGKLRVCRKDDALVVEVRDCGQIDDPLVGQRQPAPLARQGRGLWMVNQLCDLVQIRSGPEGTDVRLQMSLS
jgi:anti-sigma regulatory factor (Ser/Thr protein kinase)